MSFPDIVQSAGNCFFLAIITAALGYVGYELVKGLIDNVLRSRL